MKARLVIQKYNSDCGLACAAMISEQPYIKVLQIFISLGLYAKHKKQTPYSTNFKDVISLLSNLGFDGKVKRFKSWDDIIQPSIVKVPNGRKYSFHWIVAIPHPKHKIVIYDPSLDMLSYFENPPLDEAYIHHSVYTPNSSFISCQKIT